MADSATHSTISTPPDLENASATCDDYGNPQRPKADHEAPNRKPVAECHRRGCVRKLEQFVQRHDATDIGRELKDPERKRAVRAQMLVQRAARQDVT